MKLDELSLPLLDFHFAFKANIHIGHVLAVPEAQIRGDHYLAVNTIRHQIDAFLLLNTSSRICRLRLGFRELGIHVVLRRTTDPLQSRGWDSCTVRRYSILREKIGHKRQPSDCIRRSHTRTRTTGAIDIERETDRSVNLAE